MPFLLLKFGISLAGDFRIQSYLLAVNSAATAALAERFRGVEVEFA